MVFVCVSILLELFLCLYCKFYKKQRSTLHWNFLSNMLELSIHYIGTFLPIILELSQFYFIRTHWVCDTLCVMLSIYWNSLGMSSFYSLSLLFVYYILLSVFYTGIPGFCLSFLSVLYVMLELFRYVYIINFDRLHWNFLCIILELSLPIILELSQFYFTRTHCICVYYSLCVMLSIILELSRCLFIILFMLCCLLY